MSLKAAVRALPILGAGYLFPLPALAQQGFTRWNSWCPAFSGGGGWWGGIPMILLWLILIVAIFLGLRWALGKGGTSGAVNRESALDVLKRRYAAGEIDRDHFQEMKRELGY